MGNLIAAGTATAQSWLATQGAGLPLVMSLWIAGVALLLALLVWLGPEARGVRFGS
jgi:SHS family lactate transporter-like MFS transporter